MNAAHLDVRRAVREALADLPDDATILVACSGGADSLALAAATAFVVKATARRAGAVSVDHGIQAGSAHRARIVSSELVGMGLEPVESVHVDARAGRSGPEGTARTIRYRALDDAAARHRAAAILLGHTLDDQAETVLLGLARGSGARSLSGMAMVTGLYRRPLLHLDRDTVRAAVPAGVKPWNDPHNADAAFARARVRTTVMPVLEAELGPGVARALARSATLLRADADTLDALSSATSWRRVADMAEDLESNRPEELSELPVDRLAQLPRAIRWRVLRRAAIAAGCPPTDLTAAHIESIDELIQSWHGQVGIDLPGAIRSRRVGNTLTFLPLRASAEPNVGSCQRGRPGHRRRP